VNSPVYTVHYRDGHGWSSYSQYADDIYSFLRDFVRHRRGLVKALGVDMPINSEHARTKYRLYIRELGKIERTM
jgi:hypothetical protein